MGIFLKKYQALALSLFLGVALPALSAENDLSQAQTRFGLSFFKEILKENSDQNTLVSPYSAFSALGMVYNGAVSTTKDGMTQALGLGSLNTSQFNLGAQDLQKQLENTGSKKIELDIANSLWVNQDYSIKPDFIEANKTYYHSEVNSMDFSKPGASDKVNQWVSDKTKGKIPSIIGPLGKYDVLVLVNAVYFKGFWANPFKKEETQLQAFHLMKGATQDRPFMHQTKNFSYFETKKFQAISLPYEGNRFSLMVFLPSQKSSLASLCKNLTSDNWNVWMKKFRSNEVNLSLPKFKVEFSFGLNESLKTMGMGLAFDPKQADFSGISKNIFISKAIQKTYMLVDEEGTEAAAATAIQLRAMCTVIGQPPPPIIMTVDRPFFIALVDNQSKAILFTGAIYDPK